jgi:hypothetical protein
VGTAGLGFFQCYGHFPPWNRIERLRPNPSKDRGNRRGSECTRTGGAVNFILTSLRTASPNCVELGPPACHFSGASLAKSRSYFIFLNREEFERRLSTTRKAASFKFYDVRSAALFTPETCQQLCTEPMSSSWSTAVDLHVISSLHSLRSNKYDVQVAPT